jgi:hypothetical protein
MEVTKIEYDKGRSKEKVLPRRFRIRQTTKRDFTPQVKVMRVKVKTEASPTPSGPPYLPCVGTSNLGLEILASFPRSLVGDFTNKRFCQTSPL